MSEDTLVKTYLTDDRTLVLGSNLTIAELDALHECMLERSLHNGPVEVNASHVEMVDTASLQLIAAFLNYAVSWINGLNWIEPSDALKEATDLMGLSEFLGLSTIQEAGA